MFTKPPKLQSILKVIGSVSFLLFSLLLVLSIANNLNENTIYKDCYEVNVVDKNPSRVYYIQSNAYSKIATNCTNGFALAQKTDPEVGNPKHYFNRPFQYFNKGFGYPNKEFWLGLQNMFELNRIQNHTVLRLEFTTQIDGESFWVEYDGFTMSKVEFDDIIYLGVGVPNQCEAYPITNLGKMTSSLKNGSFMFMEVLSSFYLRFKEKLLKKELQKSCYKFNTQNFTITNLRTNV
jgi:hypothetical protein